MREKRFYTAGEFAKKAGVTIRTIRFYDNKGLLKPTSSSEAGYRLYTDADFAKLQRILTLKYLGLSLEDISIAAMNENSTDYYKKSLELQMQAVKNKISHLQLVEKALNEAKKMLDVENTFDWKMIIDIIHILNMEKDLVEQYRNSNNLKVRISLHDRFSVNKQGWFNWIFEKINVLANDNVLELGCGNGELWKGTQGKIPAGAKLVLSDISDGMIMDAKENICGLDTNVDFRIIDCSELPYESESFDKVIANHMLFYAKDRQKALSEIQRVLKPGGSFFCSTYGRQHMKQIEELTKSFDSRISLSEVSLYEIFGLENGEKQLMPWFSDIQRHIYEDYLVVNDYMPLLDYILSCHGNEHEILRGRYREFEVYIKSKVERNDTFKITKHAGLFQCCRK